jgi:broad specificity phosphatase PhoE
MSERPLENPKRTIYLIRHGKTVANEREEYNPHDDKLTAEGAAYASAARPFLNTISFDHVYCSPLPRAIATAHLLGVEAEVREELTDREMGFYSGRKYGTFPHTCTDEERDEGCNCTPLIGESMRMVRERAKQFLQLLPPTGKILVVTHSDIILWLVHELTGRDSGTIHTDNVALWVVADDTIIRENWTPWLDEN